MIALDSTWEAIFEDFDSLEFYLKFDFPTGFELTVGGTDYDSIRYWLKEARWSAVAFYDVVGALNRASIGKLLWKVKPDEAGGLADIGDFTAKISNRDNHDNTLAQGGARLEGCITRLYLTHPSSASIADDLLLWYGFCIDYKANQEDITVRVEDISKTKRRQIPPRLFDPEVTEWEDHYINQENKGKPVPLVFGEMEYCAGYTVGETHDTGSVDEGRVVQFVDLDPDNTGSFTLAVESLEEVIFGDGGMGEATGGTAQINNDSGKTEYTIDSDKHRVWFADDQPSYLYLKLLVKLHSWLVHEVESTGVTDPRNALDDDIATYTFVPTSPTPGNTSRCVIYKVPNIGISGAVETSASGLRVYAVMNADPSASGWYAAASSYRGWGAYITNNKGSFFEGSNSCDWIIGNAVGEDPTLTRNNWNTPANYEDYRFTDEGPGSPTLTDYDTLDELSTCYCGVGTVTHSGTASGSVDLYNFALWVWARIDWPASGFYAHMKGYRDNASGTITGTANAHITNGVHTAAFIHAFLTNGSTVDIWATEFDDVATNYRDGWDIGHQLNEDQIGSDEVLDELLNEMMCWGWFDRNGNLGCFPNSAPLETHDAYGLLPRDLKHGKLDGTDLTPVKDVVTDFQIRYCHNPVTDSYDGLLHCNPSSSSSGLGTSYETLCANAKQYTGNETVNKTIDLGWIRTRAAALLVAHLLITRMTTRRLVVQWTSEIRLLKLELGDGIYFNTSTGGWGDLSEDVRGAWYRICQVGIELGKNEVQYHAMEVFE